MKVWFSKLILIFEIIKKKLLDLILFSIFIALKTFSIRIILFLINKY